jgi:NAD(P)H-hydrate epimerase
VTSLPRVTSLPTVPLTNVPAVTAGEMREVDRLAMEDFGITLAQMMELAGASLAGLAARTLGGTTGKRVTVLGGPGNNGGGGLVAARHLANRGTEVHVVLAQPVGRLHAAARERLLTLIEMQVACCVAAWDLAYGELEALLADSDLLIDALLGYSANGPPRGPVRELLERAARSGTSVLSLDLPSGMNPDTGTVDGAALQAAATMTIALPKRGLLTASGRSHSGDLYLADIGMPAALYARAGLHFADPFVGGPLVRLD